MGHQRFDLCGLWSNVMANFTPISATIGGGLIGLSAVLLMLSTGRIAGISGIFGDLLDLRINDEGWRIAFFAGLILAPLIAAWMGYGMPSADRISGLCRCRYGCGTAPAAG